MGSTMKTPASWPQAAVLSLLASAVLAVSNPASAQETRAPSQIVVETNRGEASVPANPQTVIVYDLASLDTLGALGVGDPVHLEMDMIGKWVQRLLPNGP